MKPLPPGSIPQTEKAMVERLSASIAAAKKMDRPARSLAEAVMKEKAAKKMEAPKTEATPLDVAITNAMATLKADGNAHWANCSENPSLTVENLRALLRAVNRNEALEPCAEVLRELVDAHDGRPPDDYSARYDRARAALSELAAVTP